MRLIKIPNLEYKEFEALRDIIYTYIPFAILYIGYSPKLKLGVFHFFDSDYIAEELKKYILQPPLNKETVEKMSKELAPIMLAIESKNVKLK